MKFLLTGLWRHPDFRKLWAGQTVSLFGSQLRFLVLPLTAVLVLNATPGQMGALIAIGGLPSLIIGFLVGTWIDRRRKLPVLIAADLGRAALISVVPLAVLVGFLRIELLYVVAFGMGALGLVFDVAYRSLLPSLVGREQLVEGNSKLEISRSGAEVAGPGVGGLLVQILTAPITLFVDAITFVVSALLLRSIRTAEPEPASPEQRQNIWKESAEGLKVVSGSPILRSLAGCSGTIGLFNAMIDAVFVLYMTRNLGLSAGLIGLIFSIGGVGFLIGAVMAPRSIGRLGLGPAIIAGVILVGLSDLILPLASGSVFMLVTLLGASSIFFGIGLTTYNVGQVSLRQSVTPDHLQGRMNAIMRVVHMGAIPVGALLGGALGEIFDLRTTLFVAVAGELLSVVWLLISPVRSLREAPALSE